MRIMRSRRLPSRFFALAASILFILVQSSLPAAAEGRTAPDGAKPYPIHLSGSLIALPKRVEFPKMSPVRGLAVNPVSPSRESGKWVFPVPGIYYWKAGKRDGLVLVRSGSVVGDVDMVMGLVSSAASGGATDSKAFYKDTTGSTLSLFSRPGMRGWDCGPASMAMSSILSQMGIKSRLVQWMGRPKGWAHQSLEIDLAEEGSWTLYDPHFGLTLRPGVTALQIWERAQQKSEMVSLIRSYRHKATWLTKPQPWTVYSTYDLMMGMWDLPNYSITAIGAEGHDALERLFPVRSLWLKSVEFHMKFYDKMNKNDLVAGELSGQKVEWRSMPAEGDRHWSFDDLFY